MNPPADRPSYAPGGIITTGGDAQFTADMLASSRWDGYVIPARVAAQLGRDSLRKLNAAQLDGHALP